MTLTDARDYFGNYAKLAKALNISRGAVTQWNGMIPEDRQLQIHELTKGALKADAEILARFRKILRAA